MNIRLAYLVETLNMVNTFFRYSFLLLRMIWRWKLRESISKETITPQRRRALSSTGLSLKNILGVSVNLYSKVDAASHGTNTYTDRSYRPIICICMIKDAFINHATYTASLSSPIRAFALCSTFCLVHNSLMMRPIRRVIITFSAK